MFECGHGSALQQRRVHTTCTMCTTSTMHKTCWCTKVIAKHLSRCVQYRAARRNAHGVPWSKHRHLQSPQ